MDNNTPILIDSESETSMDEDEEKIEKKVNSNVITHNATNTLFNITFDNLDEEKHDSHDSVEFKDYESKLHQNMKDWKSVYYNAHKELKQSKQKHEIVDKSILPPEKKEYLDKAENVPSFIRESLHFREQAALFLEYDYAEYIDMMEDLETLYERRLNLAKANKIAENLSNAAKKY